jgi:hypothetical protein
MLDKDQLAELEWQASLNGQTVLSAKLSKAKLEAEDEYYINLYGHYVENGAALIRMVNSERRVRTVIHTGGPDGQIIPIKAEEVLRVERALHVVQMHKYPTIQDRANRGAVSYRQLKQFKRHFNPDRFLLPDSAWDF